MGQRAQGKKQRAKGKNRAQLVVAGCPVTS